MPSKTFRKILRKNILQTDNQNYDDEVSRVVINTLNNSRRMIQHLDEEGRAARCDEYQYSNYYHQYQLTETVYQIIQHS